MESPTTDDWTQAYVAHGPLEPTSAVVKLERVTRAPQDEMFPAISPDGTTLLFISGWFQFDQTIVQATLIGVDPRDPSTTTSYASSGGFALAPAWMPDGSSFLYVTNAGGWQLVRSRSMEPEAPFDTILTDDVGRPMNPSVSGDGKQVAFSLFRGTSRKVVVTEMDGTKMRELAPGDYPSFSPKGDEIFFQSFDTWGQVQLFSAPAEGGAPVQRTFGDAASVHPSHDPTGTYVVFGSTHGYEQRRCKVCCGLFVMRVDGTQIVQLVGGDVDADWPRWGQDGWIYFTSNEGGDYDVWRLRMGDDGSRVPAAPTGG